MKIRELRESLNLTQDYLAKRLKVGRTAVAMWESNKSFPRADLLPKIAEILNCSIDDLYNNERK